MKLLVACLLLSFAAASQEPANEFSYREFLGFVKKYHPLVKRANLKIDIATAQLLEARGAFDPVIEADLNQKNYDGKKYYSLLQSGLKIPTWYGIEVKAGFDNAEGVYLDPQNTMPSGGLTSLGIDIPLSQGFLINQRMADLKRAKIQMGLSQSERTLQTLAVLFDASVAYFEWNLRWNEVRLYEKYLENAKIRYNGIGKLITEGDKPAIDSVEAGVLVSTRELNLENARLKLVKSRQKLSNFLWLDSAPVELDQRLVPEPGLSATVAQVLNAQSASVIVESNPRLSLISGNIEMLEIERRLKANALLPRLDVGYHLLSPPNDRNFDFDDYKFAMTFYYPIFLRKQRGGLKVAKFKIAEAEFSLMSERLKLKNLLDSQLAENESLEKQQSILAQLIAQQKQLYDAELRLMEFGESSMFLINARENNLLSAELQKLEIENRFFESQARIYELMGNP